MRIKLLSKKLIIPLIILVLLGLIIAPILIGAEDAEFGRAFEGFENYTDTSTGGGLVGWLKNIGKDLVKSLVSLIFSIFIGIGLGFVSLSQLIFSWISDPNFISVSFTGPDNYFVYGNWIFVRNFANIGIILGLVYTGLRTALDISTRQTKTTLLKLIAIAFLVNFTPALLGLIIDASHIAMDYFLAEGGKIDFFSEIKSAVGYIANPDTSILHAFVQLAAISAGLFIAGITYLVLASIFFMRYIMLWVLIILSPLAFLAFAFPGAEKFWNQWWSSFITWAFVGIPVAFFLFLANRMMNEARKQLFWAGTSEKISQALTLQTAVSQSEIPTSSFYFIAPVALIYVGLMISLKISPSVKKVIMSTGKSTFRKAKSWGANQAKYRTAQARDNIAKRDAEDNMTTAASRIGISTAGWDDKKTSHYARHRVAEEIIKSKDATNAEKAKASQFLSATKQLDQRKAERSHLQKKLKGEDVDKLVARIYDPRIGSDQSAAAMHELLANHEEDGLKALGKLSLPDSAEAKQIFTALIDQGHTSDAKRFALSQVANYGQDIDAQAIALGIKKTGESYTQESIGKMNSAETKILAEAFKAARKKAPTDGGASLNNIIEGLFRSSREANRDLMKNLKDDPSHQQELGRRFKRAAAGHHANDVNVKATIKAWTTQGYIK
jgi:hypothetical protein